MGGDHLPGDRPDLQLLLAEAPRHDHGRVHEIRSAAGAARLATTSGGGGSVCCPLLPTESSWNLRSKPSRFGPLLVFVSVRMTNPLHSTRPHAIAGCQAAQLVVFRPERRATDVHRGVERRVGVAEARARRLDECLRPVSLPGDPVSTSAPRPRGSDALRRGPCLHSVPRSPARTLRLLCARSGLSPSPSGTRRGANVEPGGTEWGPAPPKIDPTTEDVQAIHRLPASGPPRATATSPPATSRDTERRSAPRPATRSMDASRTSDQNGPEPGHLMAEARSERTGAGDSARTANGTGALARSAVIGEGSLSRMAGGECDRPSEDAMRAARREVRTAAGGKRRELRAGTNTMGSGDPDAHPLTNSGARSVAGSSSGGSSPVVRGAQGPWGVAG